LAASAGGAAFTTTIDMSGRRPKAEVVFEAPGPDAEIVAKLRAVFATYEFESEVRVQAR